MPPFRHWADLPPELLCRIGDGLVRDLRSYVGARGVCTAWRCALVPPTPSLLVVPYDVSCRPSAASLPTRLTFKLKAIPSEERSVVSCSNGWLALSFDGQGKWFTIFNPVTATEFILPPLIYEGCRVFQPKIVFAPNPASDDFIAAAICGLDRLAYVTAGARRWAILDPVRLFPRDRLVDLFYHEKGVVYCLTQLGSVHVLRLPERRRRKSILVEDPLSKPAIPPLSPPTRRFQRMPPTQLLRVKRLRAGPPGPPIELEPHLNEPATVEPLLSHGNLPFNPATSFAPPYSRLTDFTRTKNIVFCEGNLYQIWRNESCTIMLRQPGGCPRFCVQKDEVFVLRYHPWRQPCWDVVTDLGGYSVFVGTNNAVSMYAQGVPGLKGNCVYWIGSGWGTDKGMVFDMATRRSTPCLPAAPRGTPSSTACWYFLSDMVNNCNNNEGKTVYQTGAVVQADQEKQQTMEQGCVAEGN
jgi:hypothetical protein